MGAYVNRITARTVMCSDGQLANVVVFAYKPVYGLGRVGEENRKMHVRSGAAMADAMASQGRFKTNRIVQGYVDDDKKLHVFPDSSVFINVKNLGSFDDHYIGNKDYFAKVEGVKPVLSKKGAK
jgi:hypothetical protein